jgi:hypothetical protein
VLEIYQGFISRISRQLNNARRTVPAEVGDHSKVFDVAWLTEDAVG